MASTDSSERTDWAGKRRTIALFWGLPIAALIAGGVFQQELFIWPPALTWMGGACLLNARRCGRLHCFITGPFFLLMATLSLLHGLEVVPLGVTAWDWIGGVTLVGGLALTYVPEMIWGKYIVIRAER